MSELVTVKVGGFSYLPGGLAYSQGVVASKGFSIEHFRFRNVEPVATGFKAIEDLLTSRGRPLSALCAVELRSPAPLSIDGFREFNRAYAGMLHKWGLVEGEMNAVARSNVAPIIDPPSEPGFLAFSITVPTDGNTAGNNFVVAGSSEWPEGGRFPEDVVRHGETTSSAMQEKAEYVLRAMERRLASLGSSWSDATCTQSYSAFDVFEFLSTSVSSRCGISGVLTHYCRPPVIGWDYEMDVKNVKCTTLLENKNGN